VLMLVFVPRLLAQGPSVRVIYFTSMDCPICAVVSSEVLAPLQDEYGEGFELKVVEVSEPDHYEMLIRAEELFGVTPEERGLPALVINGEMLIGEAEIRENLFCMLDTCLAAGGTTWPDIDGLDFVSSGGNWQVEPSFSLDPGDPATCDPSQVSACEAPAPIWAAYFYEVGCQNCSRAEYDIRYTQQKWPQLVVDEYNVQDHAALAEWLGAQSGLPTDRRLLTPAVFIGTNALVGAEITPDSLASLLEKYEATGAEKVWSEFDAGAAEQSLLDRFSSFGVATVAFAGLVDGLNPCAFATLIFFVSYLSISQRRGKQVLAVGIAFTLGVFITYLAVGLGFYRVLDLLGGLLATLGKWVYGVTAVLCAALAVLSLRDALRARRGQLDDMSLALPHRLRMRINAAIRKGRNSSAFVLGAFGTGLVVSVLELACTGQVYLPTIIFVVSQPDLRARAVSYLVLYNLFFIVPLLVVFVSAYYGTGSKQLTQFLQRHAAAVKLSMAMLFAGLAAWLAVSLLVPG